MTLIRDDQGFVFLSVGAEMRAFGLGIVVALAITAVAQADDKDQKSERGWIYPKFEVLHSQWPKGPDGVLLYGTVKLDCGVGANGYAADCVVKSSDPHDARIETAAIALAGQYKAHDKNQGRVPLVVSVMFDSQPDWLKKPSLDQVMASFPAAAKGQAGKALIHCMVKTDGLLRSCKVVNESPEGLGFGGAALLLAPSFLMKPAMKNGQPIESEVSVPVAFGSLDPGTYISSGPIKVFTSPTWAKTPTMAEILSELDKKIGDRFAEGKVVFQCEISKKTGRLSGCIVINSSASMVGFTGAARSLTSKFEADKDLLAGIKEDVRVNLAFSFPDMQSEAWSQRYLTHPEWVRTISPDPNQPLFPEEAAKAGLKTGSATVDCVMTASGALTQCAVISESVPGVGFGAMAQRIAQVFVANPWTDDGLPADGAHVKFPIKMVLNPEAAPAPKAKP